MSWLKIDDGFAENKRVQHVSDRAFRLHVIALCYCARNLTDGFLDDRDTKVVCAILDAPRPAKYIAELVEQALWEEVEGAGHLIIGYLEYNPDAATVKEERRKARVRMQEKRRRDAQSSPEDSDERSPEQPPEPSPARSGTPSRPVPEELPEKPSRPGGDSSQGGTILQLDSQAHALRLFAAIRDDHKDDGTKHVLLSLASELRPADFDEVLRELERSRREIRHEGKWVNGALQKRARKRGGVSNAA